MLYASAASEVQCGRLPGADRTEQSETVERRRHSRSPRHSRYIFVYFFLRMYSKVGEEIDLQSILVRLD